MSKETAVIVLKVIVPQGWSADDVLEELKTLVELSGEEIKPEILGGWMGAEEDWPPTSEVRLEYAWK